MKKYIITCIVYLSLFGSIAHAYTPTNELQTKLEAASQKLEIIISNKGQNYRTSFLEIIEEYKGRYTENEKAMYILDYFYKALSKTTASNPNILLIIADDMGLDASPGFSEGDVKPTMPHLEKMIENGLVFENLWSAPTCTPTRSTIITGKYGVKTNVTQVGDVLSTDERSLQSYLDQYTDDTYEHAVIGKWHLSKDENHPTQMGIDYYAGMLSGTAKSYWNWRFTKNGNTTTETEYATTKFTDLAIDWVDMQDEKPWFLWLAYNAPHTPFHLPPSGLHSQGNLDDSKTAIEENSLPYYVAALEAMDSEIGRFLDSLDEEERENTLIIFIGDNGTPNQVAQSPYSKRTAKGSIYQGGINVPMIVSGYGVSRVGEREAALINTSDIFSSVLDAADSGITQMHNSISFIPLLTNENAPEREYVYAEVEGTPQSGHTIRNESHKLLILDNGDTKLYDLTTDPYEKNNIYSENPSSEIQKIINDLESELGNIRRD